MLIAVHLIDMIAYKPLLLVIGNRYDLSIFVGSVFVIVFQIVEIYIEFVWIGSGSGFSNTHLGIVSPFPGRLTGIIVEDIDIMRVIQLDLIIEITHVS